MADVKQVSSGTKLESIGTVKTVVGTVKAVDASGAERILQAGDHVFANETIVTADGGLVLIEFANGSHLDLGSHDHIVLDSSVYTPTEASESKGGELSAEQIQEMIARGEDPTAVTEATAAGVGAGDEGGSSFIVVDFNNTQGAVNSGFNTQGIPGPEFTTLTELPPVEDTPAATPAVPVISVGVGVGVDIGEGGGQQGGDGVTIIPPGTTIPVAGVSAVNIAEGTSEGGAGSHPVTFVITLDQVATGPVTVTYTIVDVTTTQGTDYSAPAYTGTVTIPAGSQGFTVTMNIAEDSIPESNEQFKIVLSNPVGATLSNDTATVTIVDDDVTVNAGSGVVHEGGLEGGYLGGSTVANGNFNIDTGGDAVQKLEVGGIDVTNGGQVVGDNGTLDVTHNQDGTYSWTYTLTSPTTDVDGVDEANNFTVRVTDADGNTADTTLSVTIVDDVPHAVNEVPVSVTEDAAITTLSGNVLSNDASGADAPATFVGWSSSPADEAAIAGLNTYGTLTQNATTGEWSYTLDNTRAATQALGASDSLNYTLHYTMTDADGDTSSAQLTITVNGAADGASVRTANLEGPDATVYEHGLTSVGDTTETVSGSFTVSATDGILNVVVGGTTVTAAQLANLATTNQVIYTGEGTLTLTGYNSDTGAVSYTYTLSATIDNDSKAGATGAYFDDNVTVTVNGIGGTTASDTLSVRIVDDTPSATNDAGGTVTEDAVANTLSGNVLSNDTSGADTPAVMSWSNTDATAITALNTYGTLTQGEDGSWSYVLDSTRAATQALGAGDSQSYTLNYTMKDADGDTSTAQLTITVKGAADSASVTTASAEGADATVYEHGLTSVGDTTETTSGTFTVSATDGIANIVVGGATVTAAELAALSTTNKVISTGEGTLTLTGYNSGTGAVSYTYTLNATIDNDSKAGATGTYFDDNVTVTVNGIGGTTASDTLSIRVVDDVPTVGTTGTVASLHVDETNLSIDGTGSFANAFTFNYGADGAAATGAKTYSLGVNTSSPTGLIDTATGQAVVLSVNGSGVVEGRTAGSNALVFTLSVDSSTGGAVLDQLRAISHDSGTSVDTLNSANLITLTATATDGDGDIASATVNIGQSISFYDDGPTSTDTNGVIKNLAGQSLAGLISYDLGADGVGGVTLSYTGPTLTSHGKTVVFSLEDTNNDGIKELVGKIDLDGNAANGNESTVLTLAVGSGDATPQNGSYTLTLNDVIDLPVTRTTVSFDGISAGGGVDQLVVGKLLIEDTNINDHNGQVKPNSGFVGIDNNIMNTGETVVYKFGDTITGSSSPNYSITQKMVVNDLALKVFDTGSGSDSFSWTAYKNGVAVGTGTMTIADHQNFDFTNNLSGVTETNNTSDGLIHVDGGYDQLNISVTSGSLKIGGVSYVSVSSPQDLNLSFGYTATDGDGDAVSGSVTTTVSATSSTALLTGTGNIDTLVHTDHNIQP